MSKVLQKKMKALLSDRWGTVEYPAEWDGRFLGGGKGSQRYWEYMWTISQLEDPKFICDVGCGPRPFFPRLVSPFVFSMPVLDDLGQWPKPGYFGEINELSVVDPDVGSLEGARVYPMTLQEAVELGGLDPLIFDTVVCISVLEHMQCHKSFMATLSLFTRARVVLTLEYGEEPQAFDFQITPSKLYKIVGGMTEHYLDTMELCPVCCDNSDSRWRPMGLVFEPKLGR